ncbi:MAG: glycoside hydrolase family 16 protein [Proteobacteria bacterium]|nr:glycoside hydrolase family 16 protein [Pseudomonadota bacterium]
MKKIITSRNFKPTDDSEWTLVWSDEFDGDQVNPQKWDFDLGNGFFAGKDKTWVSGWGNDELQYYTRDPSNIFVRDSVLHIRALQKALHGCAYTSARIKTRRRDGAPLFVKQYGRFEFRAKVPCGKGLWPALWLLPHEDHYGSWAASGEIDVMEILGEHPENVLGSIHFGSTFPERKLVTHTHTVPDGGNVGDWHIYAVEWDPGEIRWLFDGVTWARQNFWWSCSSTHDGHGTAPLGPSELNAWPAPFDRPFYIVVNVAVGGNFPGAPNGQTRFPADLLVDYVRVYDRAKGYGAPQPRGEGPLPWTTPRYEPRS